MATESDKALAQQVAAFNLETVTLEEVTNKSVRLLNRLVDGLINEAFGDTETAQKNRIVPESLVKKLKELKSALAAAVQAEVTLRKTIKLRADQLTPEQRRLGIVQSIGRLPYYDRRTMLSELITKHNATFKKEQELGLAVSKDTVFVEVL